jgi:hypothetical protein
LSGSFPIQNGLKQGDALSPLLLNFALECAIRKAQKSQVGLKFNGTHQLLAYAYDVNLLGDNRETIKRTTVDLEVKVEKANYMLVSYHQNAGQNRGVIIIGNRSFKNMAQFKHLGRTVTLYKI